MMQQSTSYYTPKIDKRNENVATGWAGLVFATVEWGVDNITSTHLYISEAEIAVKGVSEPRDCAKPRAIAVFPVPGWPAMSTACPASLPSLIMFCTTPAARRALKLVSMQN